MINITEISIKPCDKNRKTYRFLSKYLNTFNYNEYINNKNLYQVCGFHKKVLVSVRVFIIKNAKAHLNYSCVKKCFRNKGINELMFYEIESICKKVGVTLITVNCRQSNKASIKSLINCKFNINNNYKLVYKDNENKVSMFKIINK